MDIDVFLGQRPEWPLLLSCLRPAADPGRRAEIEACIGQGIDWDYLGAFADHHDLLPLLHQGLARTCPALVPEAQMRFLSDQFQAGDIRNRLAFAVLLELGQALREAGIPLVVFKGVALAGGLYEHRALRQFADIDVLVHLDDLARVQALLEGRGYRPIYPDGMLRDPKRQWLDPRQRVLYRAHYHELTFQSPDGLMDIDVHWGLSPSFFPADPDLTILWRDIESHDINGQAVSTLSLEHQLLNSCIHAAKDRWRQLKWVVDIDRMLRAPRDLDWERLQRFARASQAEHLLRVGVDLSRRLLGTPVAASGPAPLSGRGLEQDLSAILMVLFRPDIPQPRVLRCLGVNRVYFRYCGGWSARLRYLARALTMPRPDDIPRFGTRLPSHPLWRLVRPAWLLASCATRIARPRRPNDP